MAGLYDETSEEVITTISMIKFMSQSRRWSVVSSSPLLPPICNKKQSHVLSPTNRCSLDKNESFVSPAKGSSWPSRGVALASIEFKRRLEKTKTKLHGEIIVDESKRTGSCAYTDTKIKESDQLVVLKSNFVKSGKKTKATSDPKENKCCFAERRKRYIPSKQVHQKYFPPSSTGTFTALPLLSIVKLTPKARPTCNPPK